MGARLTQEITDKTAFEAASVVAESANMLRREGIAIDHVERATRVIINLGAKRKSLRELIN